MSRRSGPSVRFGSGEELAGQFGLDVGELERATLAALERGDEMPKQERLPDRWVRSSNRLLRVRSVRQIAPPWMLAMDDDILRETYAAAAVGRTGGNVLGVGKTHDEALEHLQLALEADERLYGAGNQG